MQQQRDQARLSERYLTPLTAAATSSVAVVPGDPDRVATVAALLQDPREFVFRRGYRAAVGKYEGSDVYVVSTGVGGASLEHILVELCDLGVDTVIRVGTTGALQEHLAVDGLIVNDAAVRLDGTSQGYVRPEYPAAASWEVVSALVAAARARGVEPNVGVGATTASFFAGQSRDTFAGWSSTRSREIAKEMRDVGVLNFEMEAATLFTMARLFGIRAGAVCTIVNNRVTGQMGMPGADRLACQVALDAAHALDSLLPADSAPRRPPAKATA